LAISVIAYGEIIEGAHNSPQPLSHLTALREFLSGFDILPIDEATMEYFAEYRSRLRRQGMLIPDMDLLIASTASRFDLILLTRNQRHFRRIPELRFYTTN
jgi:tRNA(fMet)-specific endonuclease VapC